MALYNEQDITVHIRGTMGDGFLTESKYIAYTKSYDSSTKIYSDTVVNNEADDSRLSVSLDSMLKRIISKTLKSANDGGLVQWDHTNECFKGTKYKISTSLADDESQIPTSKAVYTAINNGFDTNNACQFKGTYAAASSSGSTLGGAFTPTAPSTTSCGWMWIVSQAGYFYDEKVEEGDLIICGKDATTLTKADYYLIQKNIDPSTYVTLAGAQTITGTKTFADVIVNGSLNVSGNIVGSLTGNATSATKLYSSAQVGSASLPVYFNQGVPVACTASSIFSSLTCSATNAISATIAGQTRSISITNFVTDALATAIEAKMPFGSYVPLAGTSTSEGKYINGSLHFAAATGERALCFNCRGVTRYLLKAQDGSADWVDTYGFKIGYKGEVTNKPFVIEMGNNGTPIEALSIGQDGEFKITSQKAPKYNANTILHTGIASVNSGTRTITINGTSTTWVNNYVTGASFATATADDKQIVRLTLTRGGHSTLADLTADISQFTGATSEAAGTTGLVPQPAKNDQNKYLRANGTWSAITTNQVYQSSAANDYWRPLILGYQTVQTKEANFSASTQQVYFDQQFRFNPSTNELYLDGSITTGNITATSLAVGNVTASGNVVANTFNGRSILDNTTNTAITASTSIITANTLYYALPKINNSRTYNAGSGIYAPTTAGTDEYILQSNGAGNAPSWITADTVIDRGITLATTTTNKTVSLQSSVWTEVDGGITITSNEPETYVIQILDADTGVVHSGVFSTGNGNESDLEEIYLQVFSNSSSNKRLYAAIQNKKLQLASDDASTTNHTVTIKYRKLI